MWSGWNNRAITDDLDLSMRLLINHWNIRFCPYAYVYEEGSHFLKALYTTKTALGGRQYQPLS